MLIRESAVAGQFYPDTPGELRKTVESFIQKPESMLEAKAVLIPHAGYIYSGPVVGKVLSSVRLPNRFIILGPNHTGRGTTLALAPPGLWRTPLGSAAVNEAMNRDLMKTCPELREDASAHRNEHCLEVQIPFLQVLRPDFEFSAICVGTADYSNLEALGHAMAHVVRSSQEPVLLVASSDMTHYETADAAAVQDQFAIDRILAIDPRGLYRIVVEKDITMCGFAPMVAVLIACIALGAASGRLIQYTNSGEASGDLNRVVAYAGIVVL
jgi:MEMO1 family protein